MRVLNVGSGSASIVIPPWYDGHKVTRLDIDPQCEPDILMDARDVGTLGAGTYDAVFCSHVLEHLYQHEARGVLLDFYHILTDDGACDLFLPDIGALLAKEGPLDLDDLLYESPAGPVTVHDMLYGFSKYQRRSEYHTHRSAWSAERMGRLLDHCGFVKMFSCHIEHDLRVVAFKREPTEEQLHSLGVEIDQ